MSQHADGIGKSFLQHPYFSSSKQGKHKRREGEAEDSSSERHSLLFPTFMLYMVLTEISYKLGGAGVEEAESGEMFYFLLCILYILYIFFRRQAHLLIYSKLRR